MFKTLRDFLRSRKYWVLALYFVVYILAFFIIEEHTPTEGYWVTDTFIDSYIPFVPGFAVFYIIWYPLFAAVGIPTLIKDGEAFKRWMYYNMFTLTATLVLDVLIPNGQHLRPQDVQVTDLGTWIFTRPWRWVITVLCVLCMASTVLVKQHAFIDTVGALIFAVPAFFLFYRGRFLRRKNAAVPS